MPDVASGEAALGPDLVVAGAGSVGMDAESGGDVVEAVPGVVEVGDGVGRHGQAGASGGSDGFAGGVEELPDGVFRRAVTLGEGQHRRARAVAVDDVVGVHGREPRRWGAGRSTR